MNGLCVIGLVAFGAIAFGTAVVLIDLCRPVSERAHPPTGGDDAASEVGGDGEFLSLQSVHDEQIASGRSSFVGNRQKGLPS